MKSQHQVNNMVWQKLYECAQRSENPTRASRYLRPNPVNPERKDCTRKREQLKLRFIFALNCVSDSPIPPDSRYRPPPRRTSTRWALRPGRMASRSHLQYSRTQSHTVGTWASRWSFSLRKTGDQQPVLLLIQTFLRNYTNCDTCSDILASHCLKLSHRILFFKSLHQPGQSRARKRASTSARVRPSLSQSLMAGNLQWLHWKGFSPPLLPSTTSEGILLFLFVMIVR